MEEFMFTNLTHSRDELVCNSAVRTSRSTDHLKTEIVIVTGSR